MHHPVWNTDPILLKIGPFSIHWYGLFFAGGLMLGYLIIRRICRIEGRNPESIEPLFLWVVGGIVIGARLAHCLFYEPDYYLAHPLEILYIWKGGLASHGGLAGAILGLWLGSRRHRIPFAWIFSRLTIPTLLVAAMIRLGNLFNSEILGKPTDAATAVVFARIDALPRHPVMLYESFAYLATFVLLILLYRHYLRVNPRRLDLLLPGVGLVAVFGARILLEFFKVPQADYSTGLPLNVGQLLSLPFFILGIVLIVLSFRSKESA
ncbi:prolipoprotein diacylglyceryl transferase [Nitratifractor sp.]